MPSKKQTKSKKVTKTKNDFSIITHWLLLSLIVLVVAYLLPGVTIDNFLAAMTAALILGILNSTFKPLLIFLTLPINFLTLGLFTLIINAVLALIVAALVPGFAVAHFGYALVFSIFVSTFTYFITHFFDNK